MDHPRKHNVWSKYRNLGIPWPLYYQNKSKHNSSDDKIEQHLPIWWALHINADVKLVDWLIIWLMMIDKMDLCGSSSVYTLCWPESAWQRSIPPGLFARSQIGRDQDQVQYLTFNTRWAFNSSSSSFSLWPPSQPQQPGWVFSNLLGPLEVLGLVNGYNGETRVLATIRVRETRHRIRLLLRRGLDSRPGDDHRLFIIVDMILRQGSTLRANGQYRCQQLTIITGVSLPSLAILDQSCSSLPSQSAASSGSSQEQVAITESRTTGKRRF